SESGALLQGKIFDDKGNRMGPSFSSKNGLRYRFYISTALRGRKHKAGTISRISAPEVESLVKAALGKQLMARVKIGQTMSTRSPSRRTTYGSRRRSLSPGRRSQRVLQSSDSRHRLR